MSPITDERKSFHVDRKGRTPQERKRLGALIRVLEAVAKTTGSPSYQDMVYRMSVRVAHLATQGMSEIAAEDQATREVVDNFNTNFKRKIERLHGQD